MESYGVYPTEEERPRKQETPPSLTTTAGGVARLLQISTRQVWRLHSLGQLPKPVRLGACVRWRVQEIRDFVDAGCPSRQEWEAMQAKGGRNHD